MQERTETAEIPTWGSKDRLAKCTRHTGKRRESGIRFPARFLTLTFYPARPYLAGLNLFVVLALELALARVFPATKGHEPVELVTVKGTV